jgi:hypothetical protein
MPERELTLDECRQLEAEVRGQLDFLHRLRGRLQHRGLASDNPLLRDVEAAWQAMYDLELQLYYTAADLQPEPEPSTGESG